MGLIVASSILAQKPGYNANFVGLKIIIMAINPVFLIEI